MKLRTLITLHEVPAVCGLRCSVRTVQSWHRNWRLSPKGYPTQLETIPYKGQICTTPELVFDFLKAIDYPIPVAAPMEESRA